MRMRWPEEFEAEVFATHWHGEQKRKYTHTPYIEHPKAVAALVSEVTDDVRAICAAWLHDVLEDTPCPKLLLEEKFGWDVASLVGWLSDFSRLEDGNRDTRKALDRRHLAMAPAMAKTVKLADLIDNSKNILEHDRNFARVYIPEKRRLLDECLLAGNGLLWTRADAIVKAAYVELRLK